MICLKCENEKFIEKEVKTEQEFRGTTLFVVTPAMVCSKCNFAQFTDEQANTLRKVTIDKYRKENALLTSDEIRKYREELGMSQAQFANYLGVGSASIKRWETCFVQEKSQDDLIRIKSDPRSAEMNALEVRWAHDQPDKNNGQKKFDLEVFKNILAKFIELAPSPLYFFKVIFYVDFLHYKQFKKGLTGMKYSCFEYGPLPKDYDHLVDYIIAKGWFSKKNKHDLRCNITFDEKIFSTDELTTINQIYALVQKKGKKHLFDKSHKEKAFKDCGALETLNYEDAKALSL